MRSIPATIIVLAAILTGSLLTSVTGLLVFGSSRWALTWLVPLFIHVWVVAGFAVVGENLIEDIVKCCFIGFMGLLLLFQHRVPGAWPLGLAGFFSAVFGTIANQLIRHIRDRQL
jgi:hypothetical protein